MSIVLIFENKDPKPWEKMLKEKLPETTIEIYPQVADKTAVDFVICWKPQKDVLTQFPKVKIIQSVGASIDHITNSQKLDKNTVIARIIDPQLSHDMWEFLLTAVLSQLKNSQQYIKNQQTNNWKQLEYRSIKNTTIGILGLGKIGGYVAEKFAVMGFDVCGWSNSKKELLNVQSFAGQAAFDNFIKTPDFLINLLPLTKETEGILNKDTLRKTKKGLFLINVGRGEHLVEKELLNLLDSSQVSGALLDVFKQEPLPKNHPFWVHPNIQITPHVASLTNVETAVDQIVENYQRFTKNIKLQHTVSLKKGY